MEKEKSVIYLGNYYGFGKSYGGYESLQGNNANTISNIGTWWNGIGVKEMARIGIKQATEKGWIECEIPGVADFSYPNSKLRRGRVQGGGKISPTLTTTGGIVKIIEWKKK